MEMLVYKLKQLMSVMSELRTLTSIILKDGNSDKADIRTKNHIAVFSC
jgi:hypothetical protein